MVPTRKASSMSPKSEDEIQEILEAYQEHGSYNATAEEFDIHHGTVKKYVEERLEGDDDGGGADDTTTTDEETPEGFTAPPPREPTDDPLDDPDFAAMDEGEFILWFFDNVGHGVRTNFAKNLAQHARVRNEIPDQAMMAKRLDQQKSGISNPNDVEMIAENYWAAAQRWMQENGKGAPNPGRGLGGRWISGDEGQHQQPQPNGGGGYVSPQQQQPPQPNGGTAPPQQQGQPQGQPPQQGGQADYMVNQLRDEISELKDTQARMMRQQQQQNGSKQQVRSMKERFQEMKEIQQTLDQMQGGDDQVDGAVQALQQEMEELRREMERESQQAEDGPVRVADGDSGFGAIARMAANDDIDPETLTVMADAMGVTDPEVKKEEYKYKTERERMENRKELVDNIFDNLGRVSDDLIGAAVNALSNRNSGNGDDQQSQGRQQQRSRDPQRDPGQNDQQSKPVGSENMAPGDIQVVGEGSDQPRDDQSASAGVSPARRRMESRDTEPQSGGREPGEFRSIGEPEGTAPRCQHVDEEGHQCPEDAIPGEQFCEEHGSAGGAMGEV